MPDVGKLFYRLLKLTVAAVLLSLAIALAALIWLWPRYNYLPAAAKPFTVERLPHNPIIHAELSPRLIELAQQRGYVNINGPSLIRVPDWIDNPLGKYYLYFAHHKGRYIRLAYADHPTGPWRIHEPGTLQLADSGFPVELEPVSDPNAALADLWQNFSHPGVS